MSVETLNCPMCGAATSSSAPQCQYCGSRLATVTCTHCFASIFAGSKFCPRCGAAAVSAETAPAAIRNCPRCKVHLSQVMIGNTSLRECEKCYGLWVDVVTFERLCASREQQAAVLGSASPIAASSVAEESRIRYLPCPECGKLMNRVNFARCSGVVVDVCKGHGTWFDHDELSRIVEFISSGGLEASRLRERREIEEARKRLLEEQSGFDRDKPSVVIRVLGQEKFAGSARGLLKFLLG